jgi:CheY-like chemotaxis protein
VKELVKAHGGNIRATSEGRDRGAILTMDLPVMDSTALNKHSSATPPAKLTTPPLKVLLVEDHVDTRQVLQTLLKRWGHQVTAASSVTEGKARFTESKFDVLISDLGLPDGSGLDLMRDIKSSAGAIFSVAVSGYGMETDLRKSHEAGFQEHLTKPISVEHLREMLGRVGKKKG